MYTCAYVWTTLQIFCCLQHTGFGSQIHLYATPGLTFLIWIVERIIPVTWGWRGVVCNFCCCCSGPQSCRTLCDPMDCSMPGFLSFIVSQRLLRLMSIESVIPSNHLVLCHPLLFLPSIFSSIMVFPKRSTLRICWPKHWSFSSALVFPMNIQDWFPLGFYWFDLLAVQGTLKSLLQHYSSKASILCCSSFFMVQLSHPYMTTGKKPSFCLYGPCQHSNVSAF